MQFIDYALEFLVEEKSNRNIIDILCQKHIF